MTDSKPRRIRTPKGKLITPAQYVSLVHGLGLRNGAPPCEHGHFGCALWESGPCSDEIGPREDAD